MAVNLSPVGGVAAQFFDNSGNVLSGGLLYTYLAGTTTPAVTYTTSNGVTAQPNPIVLDAAGRVPNSGEIWLTDGISYKFILQDQNAVQIATYDNIIGINSNFISYTGASEEQTATQGQTVFTLTTIQYQPGANNLAVYVNGSKQIEGLNYIGTSPTIVTFNDGLNVGDVVEFNTAETISTNAVTAAEVSYIPAGTGAVPTNVQAKLRQYVSVIDFGAVGDGVADDTNAVIAASAANVGDGVFFPAGTYLLSADVTFACNVIMDSGAQIVSSDATVFSAGFEAPLEYCLDVSGFVQFLNIVEIYPQWFGAMGDAVFTTGTINAGSTALTVNTGLTSGAFVIQNGDTVFINGAGTAGGVFSSTVVSGGGTANLILANAAVTSVSNRAVATRNNTTALQRFFASVKAGASTSTYGPSQPSAVGCTKLYVPAGIYCSFDEITMYSGCVLEGEFGNTIGGSRIVQCNRNAPLINVLADNFNIGGSSTNGGNGNNIFRNIGFSGSEIADSVTNSPVINFQYAWNIHSDTELDHVLWQNTAGACVGGGFATTGTISSGSTTLTLTDGSVFRNGNVGGGKITVVGAGVAGANLDAYIVSGGGTNTVTISTAASTSVTNAVVYPQTDAYGLKINDCEMDVCRAGFDFAGNSSGSLVINNLLAFNVVRGAIRVFSVGAWQIELLNSELNGCGNPQNTTDVTWRNSIIVDSEYEGSLTIDACSLLKSGSFGGRISYKGNNFICRNSTFTDLDSAYNQKFISAECVELILQNNKLSSSSVASYTNARMMSASYANMTVAKITGNIFENTNASSYEYFIQSNTALDSWEVTNNTFKGNVTTVLDTNLTQRVNTIVLNKGLNPIQQYRSGAPGTGTWAVGAIVWNTAPASGGNIGWVCTTAGTPGTWKTFGVIA